MRPWENSTVTADPLRYWQDIDDPNWSDETEARFITELSVANIESAFRPRDEFDEDVDPETLRGKVLAWYDARDEALGRILATRRGRLLWRLPGWSVAVRRRLRR